jgi:hypothetical protein
MKKMVLTLAMAAVLLAESTLLKNSVFADDPPIWDKCTVDPQTGIKTCPSTSGS